MGPYDLAQVRRLSDREHPGLPERLATLERRLAVFPAGCIVLAEDTHVHGYAFSHPIRPGEPPALDSAPDRIGDDATQFYVHDFVVSPTMRGSGHARAGVEKLLETGDAYDTTALISVYGTAGFWVRFGFEESAPAQADKLRSYGAGAVFMVRAGQGRR